MKNLILFIALISTCAIIAQDYPQSLPEFEIWNQNNEKFSQDDVSTESYSYFVYFNPTCGHCQTAFKTLNLHVDKLKNARVKLYPVSTKNQKETLEFFKGFAPKLLDLNNIQILLEDDYKFADVFFVGSYPTAYLYDKQQKLVKVYNGEGEIMAFLDEIK
ncbi:MAG: redoxin domain-containing protein [Bacteroidetes bacterium]|jgi:protein-disulfide isomerase|nr:redoxin domain-containing protein [Bacteroidota bacterium]